MKKSILTNREKEIFELLIKNFSTKDIAKNVLNDIFYGIKDMFADDDSEEKTEESSDTATDTG